MKRPNRKHIVSKRIGDAPAEVDLLQVADRVRYVGSQEHKTMPSPAGEPKPRADASICQFHTRDEFVMVNGWLRAALLGKKFSEMWENGFPRYLWYRNGDQVYEARLTNRGLGEYKGYPLEPDQVLRNL